MFSCGQLIYNDYFDKLSDGSFMRGALWTGIPEEGE